MAVCSKCGGRGKYEGQCDCCEGTGEVVNPTDWRISICALCNGTGKNKKCD